MNRYEVKKYEFLIHKLILMEIDEIFLMISTFDKITTDMLNREHMIFRRFSKKFIRIGS